MPELTHASIHKKKALTILQAMLTSYQHACLKATVAAKRRFPGARFVDQPGEGDCSWLRLAIANLEVNDVFPCRADIPSHLVTGYEARMKGLVELIDPPPSLSSPHGGSIPYDMAMGTDDTSGPQGRALRASGNHTLASVIHLRSAGS